MTPAAVSSTKGVSLADKLRLSELPLATTPGGKAFCLKALHPSEHTLRATRVPGGNKPSVAICCDMVQTFPIADAASSVNIRVIPSIVVPASIRITKPDNTQTWGNFYNAAFGGSYVASPSAASTRAVMQVMYPKISQYRITSQSVTCELIAPSLRDQGTITSAQYDLCPFTGNTSSLGAMVIDTRPDIYMYPEPPPPSQMILGTSAYTAKARDGCYLPLKLTSFKWKDFRDLILLETAPATNTFDVGQIINQFSVTDALAFPYYENRAGLAAVGDIPLVPKLCGSTVGSVVFEGMDSNVAIRVRVRQVVEIIAPPSTTYAPLLESPLPPDDLALRMYFEVSGRMKDAYPASYNDLGKLLDTISSIGKQILPYIDPALDAIANAGVPGLSPAAAVAKRAKPVVESVVKAVRGARGKGKASKQPAKSQPKVIMVEDPRKKK